MSVKDDVKTVLLVDDDVDYLEQQRMMLESKGFEVITAETRAEAEEILETTEPDLAILDLMMQEMDDGFVLSYHVKKRYPNTPVIIVSGVTSETGMDFDDGAQRGSWIKADALIPKPIRFEQLSREIERLTGWKK